MLRSLFLSTLLLLLSACGQPGKVTETKFVISGAVATTPIDFSTAQAMVTAFNLSTQQIVRVQLNGNTQTLTLPNGSWTFSVVHWDDLNTEGAQVRCGATKQELSGEPLNLDVSVTVAECRSLNFNATQFDTGSDLQPLEINQCATFGLASDNCDLTPGIVRSVKITFPNILLSTLFTPAVDAASGSVSSGCIEISANDGTVDSFTKLPSGSANVPIPFVIRAFSGPGCTGTDNNYIFHRGLLSLDRPERRVHDHISNTTRLLIRDGSIAALHTFLTLPAETSYQLNMNNFFFGGTPPYTFSQTGGCGSLTGSMFSGNGAANGGCSIVATDADSNQATFTFSTVVAVYHQIFTSSAGPWAVTRSTSNLSMNSPGSFSVVSTNFPRFVKTLELASPLIPAQNYLLLEKPVGANILGEPINFTNGSFWSATGPISRTLDNSFPISSFNHYRIEKTSGASGSLTHNISTAQSGHRVASVYLKKGTSRFAGLRLQNSFGGCSGVVIDLDTGALQTMGGCALITSVSPVEGTLSGSEYIGNGWWRVHVAHNFPTTTGFFKIYPAWSTTLSAVEDLSVSGSIYAFNAQLDSQDRPSSPLPDATARPAESAAVGGLSTNLSAGSFVFDWHAREPEPNKTLVRFCNSSNLEAMSIVITSGKPVVRFLDGTFAQSLTDQDVSRASQNRLTFKIGSGQLRVAKRDDATMASAASSGHAAITTPIRIGQTCPGADSAVNLGVRRIGHWSVQFEDVVLKEMSNSSN